MPKFEWDENKNRSNKEKHGIDFNVAKRIFDDEKRLEIEDNRFDYGEKRWKVLGFVFNVFLSVIFTLRDTTIRIISARRASKKERELYNSNLNEED